MSNEMLASLLKEIDNDYASIAESGVEAGDVTSYLDTGSYSLNALLSGSIYGGIPGNKVTALAGEPSTGKTFYAINIAKTLLDSDPEAFVFYFESESAISKSMLEDREVDTKRVAVVPVSTVQEFRTQAVKILDAYLRIAEKNRKPMLFVLDSLGNLSTDKEVEDIASGKDTRDMTRAQLIKAAFRVLTLKLGKAKVPLIVTNHVYSVIGSYIPTQKMGGGSGLDYCASTIVFLSKKKNKDKDNQITGAIITATLKKARHSIENKKVETLLDYQKGLDRHYGIVDIAEKLGVIKKGSDKKLEFPNGDKAFEVTVLKNPEKYFTKDVIDAVDEKCADEFLYGKTNAVGDETEEV